MNITGSYIFNFDRQTVWNILMNPDAIAKSIPGVKEMIPLENETNAWRAVAKLSVAAVSGSYSGLIRMTEIDAPNQYRLTVSGEGQQSIINGTALIKLDFDSEQNKTTVSWDAEAHLSGKLAGVAQRLIKVAAGLLSRQFFGGLARQLGDPVGDPVSAATDTEADDSPLADTAE